MDEDVKRGTGSAVQRQEFIIGHSDKVVHDVMGFSGDGFAGVGGGESDNGCA